MAHRTHNTNEQMSKPHFKDIDATKSSANTNPNQQVVIMIHARMS